MDGGERAAGAAGRTIATAGAFWLLGLLLAFHPTLLTGLARIQGAPDALAGAERTCATPICVKPRNPAPA